MELKEEDAELAADKRGEEDSCGAGRAVRKPEESPVADSLAGAAAGVLPCWVKSEASNGNDISNGISCVRQLASDGARTHDCVHAKIARWKKY